MFFENLIGIKLNTLVRKEVIPFFVGFDNLDMYKHIIYDFYYYMIKSTLHSVELLGQDTDSIIIQLNDRGNIVYKMYHMYKSFNLSKLDNTSYCYGQLENYY